MEYQRLFSVTVPRWQMAGLLGLDRRRVTNCDLLQIRASKMATEPGRKVNATRQPDTLGEGPAYLAIRMMNGWTRATEQVVDDESEK
jgi:hypothetical protein